MNFFTITAVVLQLTGILAVPVELRRSRRFGTSSWRSALSNRTDKIRMKRLIRSIKPKGQERPRLSAFLHGNPITGYRVLYKKN